MLTVPGDAGKGKADVTGLFLRSERISTRLGASGRAKRDSTFPRVR
ncbi:MAG: hypothetical protein ABIR57_09985 [Aeromicrobium sp.]